MWRAAIPLVHINRSSDALEFYTRKLGFNVQSTYRTDQTADDPAYIVVTRDSTVLHLSSFSGDGVAGGVVTIAVDDIERVHDDLVHRGIDVGSGIMDQTWGNREVYVRDPSGNTIRFQSE